MNISNSSKLIKVSSKSITWSFYSLISCWYPRSTFHDIMPLIKCWCAKIIIIWVDFEIFIWINWSLCMLPYISYNIKYSFNFVHIDWIAWAPFFKINISSCSRLPLINIFWKKISNCIPLILSRESNCHI